MDVLMVVLACTVVASWWIMDKPSKRAWMLIPHAVRHNGEWHRVVSHAFVHADWMHLALNMFVLHEFGRTVQADLASLGWAGFPALYLAGILGGAVPALRKHADNPGYASLGASGAVSAVLVAFIALHPTHTLLLFFVVPIPAVLAGLLFFWYESKRMGNGASRIAHDAHLGGGLVGLVWVLGGVPGTLPRMIEALQALFV
jgi:membrane associated rhomboid family serine protease